MRESEDSDIQVTASKPIRRQRTFKKLPRWAESTDNDGVLTVECRVEGRAKQLSRDQILETM